MILAALSATARGKAEEWVAAPLDTGAGSPSLATISGRPALAYGQQTDGLKFVRADDDAGTSWGMPLALGESVGAALHTSLAVVEDRPAILFGNGAKYVRAKDEFGAAWGDPVTLGSSAVSAYAGVRSLAVVNGYPAAVFRSTNASLGHFIEYARSLDAQGVDWPAATTVSLGVPEAPGYPTLLPLPDGRPGVVNVTSEHRLLFTRGADPDGKAWDATIVLAGSPSSGESVGAASAALIGGRPAVCYYDLGSQEFRYLRAADAGGLAWESPRPFARDVGCFADSFSPGNLPDASLAEIDGRPAVCYRSCYFSDLKFVQAANAEATIWGNPRIVESAGLQAKLGYAPSLASINSLPGVAYENRLSPYPLKFARLSTATPTPLPEPGPSPIRAAQAIFHSLPEAMAPGQALFVGVILRNTGNVAWTAQDGYSLGVEAQSNGSLFPGPRIGLPPDSAIQPGEVFTFVARIAAPPYDPDSANHHGFRLRMLQEFVEWFGDPIEWVFQIQIPPNHSRDWAIYD